MNFTLIVTIIIVILAMVVLLFLPRVAFRNGCNGNAAAHENPPAMHVTKAGYLFSLILMSILVGGVCVEAFAPNSWMGDLLKAVGGFSGWSFYLSLLASLAALGLPRLGIDLYSTHDPLGNDPDPVKVWTPIEEDKELAPGAAYAIEIHNDDKTKMVFVIGIFCRCFGMNRQDAHREMMAIHDQGSRAVGSMSRLNADALVEHIRVEASQRGFPLQCKVVPALRNPASPK